MSVMDKLLNAMRLNPNDEDYYEDDDYLDDEEEIEEPAPRKKMSKKIKEEEEYYEERTPKKSLQPKITPMRQPVAKKVSASANGMEVCVIKPSSVEEAREITETLLSNRTVVLNLEGLDVDVAQRIIDFTSGSCFAVSGNLQKISHYIFIVTPASVDISGDFLDILGGAYDGPLDSGM